MTAIRIGSGDEWPASALKGWGVVVEVDAADQVTVSVAGLDRVVAVGLLREAADVLEAAPDEATATYEPMGAEPSATPALEPETPAEWAAREAAYWAAWDHLCRGQLADRMERKAANENILLSPRDDVKPWS